MTETTPKKAARVSIVLAKDIRCEGKDCKAGETVTIPADMLEWAKKQRIVKEG